MGWLKDIVKSIKPIDLISGGVGVATRIVAPKAATAINAGRLVIAGTVATGGIIGGAAGAVVAKGTNTIAANAVQSESRTVSTSAIAETNNGEVLEAKTSNNAIVWIVIVFLGLIYLIFRWK